VARASLITFSGIDCSGKSTQIELLASALRERGHTVATIWFRPGYSSILDGARWLVRRIRPGLLPTSSQSAEREKVFANGAVRDAWIIMAMGDTLAQYALRVRALLLAGRTVLCDRYLEDARLDLQLRFSDRREAVDRSIAALQRICPRPTASFLLTLSREEIMRRMAVKAEPFPDAEAIREQRLGAYRALAGQSGFDVVDADRPVDAIHRDILARTVGSSMPTDGHAF